MFVYLHCQPVEVYMMCHALNSAPTQRQLVGRYEEEKWV
jgi:hypothetical protein